MPANPLEWLGAIMPNAPRVSEKQREMHKKKTQQEILEDRKQHPTRAMISDTLNAIGEFTKGATIGDDSYLGRIGEVAGAFSDAIPEKAIAGKVLSAGLPFLHYVKRGLVPEGYLAHATKDAKKLLPHGVIDESSLRVGSHGHGLYNFSDKSKTRDFWEGMMEEGMPETGASIPVVPEAKNVLDLVSPDPKDIHQVMKALPPGSEKRYMDYFNDLMEGRTHEGRRFTNKEAYQELGKVMGLQENTAKMAGFDAVRYPYAGSDAWMIPNTTPMKTPHGVPLNEAAGGISTAPVTPLEVSGPTRQPPIPRSRGARTTNAPAMGMGTTPSPTLSNAVSVTPGVEATPATALSTPVTSPVLSNPVGQKPRLIKPEKKMSVAEVMATPSNLSVEEEAKKKAFLEDIRRKLGK